jgi:hypothetical protein
VVGNDQPMVGPLLNDSGCGCHLMVSSKD